MPTVSSTISCVVIFVAAVVVAACGGSSPTAPPPAQPLAPSPSFATYSGTITILGASPRGNCAADAMREDAGGQSGLTVVLPDIVGSFSGSYSSGLLHAQCNLKLTASGSDFVDVELYPYCDDVVSDWIYGQTCTPADGHFVGSAMHLPAPSANAIRGDGTITVAMGPAPLSDVEVAVRFDLTKR